MKITLCASSPNCFEDVRKYGPFFSPTWPVLEDWEKAVVFMFNQKLRQRLEELGQREVSFEDDSKELFYIKNEEKIKKSIVGIEKILYENGLLRDLDDDLHTFHSKTSQVELAMLDTGNELLNRKLMEFIEKQTSPMFM
uniref:Cullin domain-containing protein n=1 Tax=Angiostrongylus cantonensis TaxID=6313 RepID=A0A0K0D7C8_ANGCA